MELLYFIAGLGFGYFLFTPKKGEKEKAPFVFNDQKELEEETEKFVLRNGFKVTKDENPTFAEQWVNIMNYSGENQKEENYEETTEDYTTDDLG